nr:unnamed protein product [Digitaria exilis]
MASTQATTAGCPEFVVQQNNGPMIEAPSTRKPRGAQPDRATSAGQPERIQPSRCSSYPPS